MRSFAFACLLALASLQAAVPDRPFLQDAAVRIRHAAELASATYQKLCVDLDGVVYVLTDRGVARVYDDFLALDRSYRPLAGQRIRDITTNSRGHLYYLLEDRWLSNGEAGQPLGHFGRGAYDKLAVATDGLVLLAGEAGLAFAKGDEISPVAKSAHLKGARLFGLGQEFYALTEGQVFRLQPDAAPQTISQTPATALARSGDELLVGTKMGYFGLDAVTGRPQTPRQTRLPVQEITCLLPAKEGLWMGTTRGVVFQQAPSARDVAALPEGPGGIRYYASRRWLNSDPVLDLALDKDGHLWVLTPQGLNKIEVRRSTLAEKAEYFDRKVRSRHIRFGLTGERRLPQAGDVASSEIIDTDNDGGWSSYYLASQAFRFAVTGDERARSHAWEVFGALERLQKINPIPGFPARTFERAGFKFSDVDRWREVPGGDWEWKGHTSSDEIASQTFAHAVLWECVARNDAERERVRRNYTAIVDHIIAHAWYLVDVDGKPTLWGRWHPEYVNSYPPTIFDRRLNSAEITASLQLAYAMSGQARYREKAYELFEQHGYLTNILSSMKLLQSTLGYVHQGNEMGDEWNHSDDELAFVTYWVLYRFAFTENLRRQYGTAIREHWEFERDERFPMWNFIYAGCGGATACDAEGAVWTLRSYPLETITWRIENSHRMDLTKLPPNFMKREMAERLPPAEHQVARCNTQPFILDGGDGGHIEFPGDEYLLGYWLGRYLGLID